VVLLTHASWCTSFLSKVNLVGLDRYLYFISLDSRKKGSTGFTTTNTQEPCSSNISIWYEVPWSCEKRHTVPINQISLLHSALNGNLFKFNNARHRSALYFSWKEVHHTTPHPTHTTPPPTPLSTPPHTPHHTQLQPPSSFN
jgi:hypothetical protein